jgi:hypothetical protein
VLHHHQLPAVSFPVAVLLSLSAPLSLTFIDCNLDANWNARAMLMLAGDEPAV